MKIIESDLTTHTKERRYKLKIKNIPAPYYPTRGNNFPILYFTN